MSNIDQPATAALHAIAAGDKKAVNDLLPLVYDKLRVLAASALSHERLNHTLQPTALVHEAYLKLIDQTRVNWRDQQHFLAVASMAIRRILVDHARNKKAAKRGGDGTRVPLEELAAADAREHLDVLALDEALSELAALDAQQARVAELRYFGGLNDQTIADFLGVSKRTVVGDWALARAWLSEHMSRGD